MLTIGWELMKLLLEALVQEKLMKVWRRFFPIEKEEHAAADDVESASSTETQRVDNPSQPERVGIATPIPGADGATDRGRQRRGRVPTRVDMSRHYRTGLKVHYNPDCGRLKTCYRCGSREVCTQCKQSAESE